MFEIDATRDVQKTFAIIKPDAVEQGFENEIMHRIEEEGFTIISHKRLRLTPEQAGDFYKEHDGKSFYETLIKFMTRSDCIVLVLAAYDAVLAWRALIGPTNIEKARAEYPNSIRALFGTSTTFNAVHGSADPASANREIKFFFPNVSTDAMPSKDETKQYVQQHFQATLLKALTIMCKEKPKQPTVWLANWLLEHNPNKPQILEASE